MLSTWFFDQLRPDMPGLWLVLSLLTGIIGYGLTILRPRMARIWSWLAALGWLGIPYAGLLLGGLSPRLMGLNEIDWLASAGWGVGLILALLAFLFLLRSVFLGQSWGQGLGQSLGQGEEDSPGESLPFPLLRAGVQEFHWVFLRGGLWALLLSLGQIVEPHGSVTASILGQPAYWATWLAAIIGMMEMVLAARLRNLHRPQQIVRLFTLLATSVLFLYTRNFWLCWLLHAGIIQVLGRQTRWSRA